MEKMASDGPKRGQEDFFPTNPDLANILGRTDLDFENFYLFHFLDPKFLDFQVPNFWIPRSQKSGFPDFQKSGFPGFQKIHTAAGRPAGGRADLHYLITTFHVLTACLLDGHSEVEKVQRHITILSSTLWLGATA